MKNLILASVSLILSVSALGANPEQAVFNCDYGDSTFSATMRFLDGLPSYGPDRKELQGDFVFYNPSIGLQKGTGHGYLVVSEHYDNPNHWFVMGESTRGKSVFLALATDLYDRQRNSAYGEVRVGTTWVKPIGCKVQLSERPESGRPPYDPPR